MSLLNKPFICDLADFKKMDQISQSIQLPKFQNSWAIPRAISPDWFPHSPEMKFQKWKWPHIVPEGRRLTLISWSFKSQTFPSVTLIISAVRSSLKFTLGKVFWSGLSFSTRNTLERKWLSTDYVSYFGRRRSNSSKFRPRKYSPQSKS